MAGDRKLHQRQHHSQYYAPIPARIIHEYDFFAEAAANKYKKAHILPLPENPEALREFFVPELVPPPRVFRRQKKTAKDRHREIPHPKLIDKAATSIRIFGVDINVDQETSINKGKEKMMHMGESSSNIQGIIINELDKNTTTAAATNLGNPNVDHQEIQDPKLIDKAATSIRKFGFDVYDQETAIRSIDKGKEKMLHVGESSSINQAAYDEDKNTRSMGAATNLGNPNVDHQEIRDTPKLQVDGSLHDDQETARSINKGKEKMLHMGDSSNTRTMGNAKGIIINEEKKNTARNPTTNLENPKVVHRHYHDIQEPNPPPFHPKILKEIREPPIFLFEKKLEPPDLYSGPNRLRILDPTNVIRFMNREERSKMHNGGFVCVITREAARAVKEHVLQLAKLEGRHDIVLVLRGGWLSVLADLRLKLGDLVQGWGYRKDGEFRLALNIIRVPYSKS